MSDNSVSNNSNKTDSVIQMYDFDSKLTSQELELLLLSKLKSVVNNSRTQARSRQSNQAAGYKIQPSDAGKKSRSTVDAGILVSTHPGIRDGNTMEYLDERLNLSISFTGKIKEDGTRPHPQAWLEQNETAIALLKEISERANLSRDSEEFLESKKYRPDKSTPMNLKTTTQEYGLDSTHTLYVGYDNLKKVNNVLDMMIKDRVTAIPTLVDQLQQKQMVTRGLS